MERDDRPTADERASAERGVSDGADTGGGSAWERVERTSAFERMMRRKRAFFVPIVIFYCVFYLAWPVLAELTTVLNGPGIGAMSWAVIYGLAQFPMVLIVAHLFLWQANKWDGLVDEARQEASEGRTTA